MADRVSDCHIALHRKLYIEQNPTHSMILSVSENRSRGCFRHSVLMKAFIFKHYNTTVTGVLNYINVGFFWFCLFVCLFVFEITFKFISISPPVQVKVMRVHMHEAKSINRSYCFQINMGLNLAFTFVLACA